MPKEDDEFSEFFVGVQIIIEVIREKIAEFESLNTGLERRVRERTSELDDRLREVETLNKAMVNRELKMTELKSKNAELQREIDMLRKKSR